MVEIRESDDFFSIDYVPTSSVPKQKYHIFFITGNPGLIGYYKTFFHMLADNMSSTSRYQYSVCGYSLAGFELEARPSNSSGEARKLPLGLQEQIEYVEGQLLDHFADRERPQEGGDAEPEGNKKVILIGHSAGSYALLEILRRHRERKAKEARGDGLDIVGGILLFPTVVDIAKSPTGRKMGVSATSSIAICASTFVQYHPSRSNMS